MWLTKPGISGLLPDCRSSINNPLSNGEIALRLTDAVLGAGQSREPDAEEEQPSRRGKCVAHNEESET